MAAPTLGATAARGSSRSQLHRHMTKPHALQHGINFRVDITSASQSPRRRSTQGRPPVPSSFLAPAAEAEP